MPTKKKKLKKAKKKATHSSTSSKKKVAAKSKVSKKMKSPAKKKPVKRKPVKKKRIRGRANSAEIVTVEQRGLGAGSGGQSGDTQGLSDVAETDSESVKELLEEGQSFEAEVVRGVENAPDP